MFVCEAPQVPGALHSGEETAPVTRRLKFVMSRRTTSHSIPAAKVLAGAVAGVDTHAVGNNGEYFALGRRCRHLRADLADGSIDDDGCLVCPWHDARYDVSSGTMVAGPQGIFAKIPGLSQGFKALSRVLPLKRGTVDKRATDLFINEPLIFPLSATSVDERERQS